MARECLRVYVYDSDAERAHHGHLFPPTKVYKALLLLSIALSTTSDTYYLGGGVYMSARR
jgi:hypothetical protein